jgi:hypothetical protein
MTASMVHVTTSMVHVTDLTPGSEHPLAGRMVEDTNG